MRSFQAGVKSTKRWGRGRGHPMEAWPGKHPNYTAEASTQPLKYARLGPWARGFVWKSC